MRVQIAQGCVGVRHGTGRGRSRVARPLAPVTAWLPPQHYERLVRIAQQRDQSVSSLVRNILIFRLTT